MPWRFLGLRSARAIFSSAGVSRTDAPPFRPVRVRAMNPTSYPTPPPSRRAERRGAPAPQGVVEGDGRAPLAILPAGS